MWEREDLPTEQDAHLHRAVLVLDLHCVAWLARNSVLEEADLKC